MLDRDRSAPTVADEPAISCPVCRNSAVARVFVSRRGDVMRCADCGVFFVRAAARGDAHERMFYSAIDQRSYGSYFEPFRKGQYRSVLDGLGLAPNASLLDVGASYGWMVEVALQRGLDAYGLEPGVVSVPIELRSKIFNESLSEFAGREERVFDLVTLWHVLEHMTDPHMALDQIRSLTGANGRLLIAVPNAEGRLFRLGLTLRRLGFSRLIDELFYFGNPNMHFYYYAPRAIAELVAQHGFSVQSVRTLDSFDWPRMYQRTENPLLRGALRIGGALIGATQYTARDNLVVVCAKVD